jgi:hypothetical protein
MKHIIQILPVKISMLSGSLVTTAWRVLIADGGDGL